MCYVLWLSHWCLVFVIDVISVSFFVVIWLFTAPSPTPYGLPFSKIGGSQPHPKTAITIISGTSKSTDCKFGRYIHRVHPNTSPWKILEKRERGHIQGQPKIFWVCPIISGMDKVTNFKFGRYIHRVQPVHANKSPLKFGRIGSVGESRDSPNFWSTPYYLVTVCVALYVFSFFIRWPARWASAFSGSLPRVILILCLFSSNC